MKRHSLFILLFAFIYFFGINKQIFSQPNISKQEWQEDIGFLRDKVHSDYSFLFKKVSEQDFDNAVNKLLEKVPNMENHEIIVGIAELVALFGFGHTVLWLTSWRYNESIGFSQLPINYYAFSDGIYLQGVHRDYEEVLGAKVLKIGNMNIEQALEAIKPVVSYENDQFFIAHGINYLGVPEVLHAKGVIDNMESVKMEVEKDGKVITIHVKPMEAFSFPGRYSFIQENDEWLDVRSKSITPLWLKDLHKRYYFEYLQDTKTVYVRHSSVTNDREETIEQFFNKVFDFIEHNEVDKFILDVRLNSGGNNYLNKPIIKGVIRSKIDQVGKFYVIIGRRTFSACQNLVNELENYTNVIFAGEPTAENVNFYGDNNQETLPNSGLRIRLSFAWWQDMDPRDTRPWTSPTIPASLSINDYVNNIDPTLKRIEKYSEVEGEFKTLILSNNFETLKTLVLKYQKRNDLNFINFKNKINELGYRAIQNNDPGKAISIFNINTELHPEYVNGWDSLAEAYWRSGDIQKAKDLYNKVIQMEPNGRVAENARNMLRIINQQ